MNFLLVIIVKNDIYIKTEKTYKYDEINSYCYNEKCNNNSEWLI